MCPGCVQTGGLGGGGRRLAGMGGGVLCLVMAGGLLEGREGSGQLEGTSGNIFSDSVD